MSAAFNPHVVETTGLEVCTDSSLTASFLSVIGQDVHLCSIVPDGGGCNGRWFGTDLPAATTWAVSESKAGRNVYWTVNRVAENCNRKPAKVDIVGVRFAHIDIDPPKTGGAFDKLKTHAELLSLPAPPTLIIDSGGGLQAFWRLAGPASVSEIEAVNRSLAGRLGGDNCHNVDRLMRLPGTINYPTIKKRAAGRIPALAKVIYDAAILLN